LIEDRAMRARMSAAARERSQEFCHLRCALARLADAFGLVARPSLSSA
jgi:hypothetical protein